MFNLAHDIMIPPNTKKAKHDDNDNEEDRLSDLPDCILLHILSFLNSKHAVQTCILSPRWKNLWKYIPTLKLHSSEFRTAKKLGMFVTKILTLRDTSTALHALNFKRIASFEPQRTLKEIVNYACSHNTQLKRLGISVKGDIGIILPRISSCQALTSLKLAVYGKGVSNCERTLFPKHLNFPALTSLDLSNFAFCANDNADHAEPFSSFSRLNNLIISRCSVRDASILTISSATIVHLTMCGNSSSDFTKIKLSAPSLDTITFYGTPSQRLYGSSLSSVKQLNIDEDIFIRIGEPHLILLSWLQDLDNIKSLTVTAGILQILSLVPDLFNIKLPSLHHLKSLKVKLKPHPHGLSSYIRKEVVYKYKSRKEAHKIRLKEADEPYVIIPKGIVDFLLQNSPSAEVGIIHYMSKESAGNYPVG
ncbi:unnamed protein product [Trifolium pratense]|uniref:Uncharacterized protein n=2 Tax=Trifolium pratense TaxID=57577 RepID=A0ACB0MD46_TRIPR|nr:unnamed protein product [Trifolium pratense]